MRTIPHRVPISRRRVHSAASLEPSATEGSAAPTSPCSSVGTAKDDGPPPPSFAMPVLIHHTSNAAAEDSAAGTPGVLLLNGPPGTPFIWYRVLPVLRSRGLQPCTVKRPDYPSVAGQAGDPFAAAADIAQLLDDQQHSPAVIVGHSLGVGVALALAATAPHHVRALVLVAPAAGVQPISIADRLLAAPILGPAVSCLGFRAAGLALHLPALRRGILTTRAGFNARDAGELVREITFGTIWRKFAKEQRRLVSDARRRNQALASIDCPVLVIAGTHDRILARRSVRALRRLLPVSEVIATTAARHLIPIDDPDSIADAVLRALRREYRTTLSASPYPRQRPQGHVPIHRNRDQA
jgi:pimeloyl-ACP methyl ester carboxylesterase